MSNTHNRRQTKKEGYNPAELQDLPPLTPDSTLSSQSSVCATMQLYLAVWDDLASEQRRLVSSHLRQCGECAHVQRLFQGVTRLITHLPETLPSAGVDHAVFDAVAINSRMRNSRVRGPIQKSGQLVLSLSRQAQFLPSSSPYRSCRTTVVMTLLILVLSISSYLWMKGIVTLETFQLLFNRLHDGFQLIWGWLR
jgi:hypothetical protein